MQPRVWSSPLKSEALKCNNALQRDAFGQNAHAALRLLQRGQLFEAFALARIFGRVPRVA